MGGDSDHQIQKFSFKPSELKKVHPDHLGFIISSSLCCNDISLVGMHIIFEQQRNPSLTPAELAFINCRQMMVLRHLIAKIFEYNQLVQKYFAAIRVTYPAGFENIRGQYSEIAREIGKATWVATFRNKIAFHFDPAFARKSLDELTTDDEVHMYAGQYQGATVFEFADDVILGPLISSLGNGNLLEGLKVVSGFAASVSGKIVRFHATTMITEFEAQGLLRRKTEDLVREERCGELDGARIPLMVGKRSLRARGV